MPSYLQRILSPLWLPNNCSDIIWIWRADDIDALISFRRSIIIYLFFSFAIFPLLIQLSADMFSSESNKKYATETQTYYLRVKARDLLVNSGPIWIPMMFLLFLLSIWLQFDTQSNWGE